jgi:hypothetical protein
MKSIHFYLLVFLFSFVFSQGLFATLPIVPEGYFRSPVDVKIYLSGTFGEPRSTHFHTGIDIKTQGVEGKSIYAVAEGYISRVAVSPYGYGNALYLTHPNGIVSVYGHLQKFSSEIQEWVKQQQRMQSEFAINMEFMDPSLFPIDKGDVIAKSGNSGGSGGPHLHFELRDSLEHPLNPLLYGFKDWIIDQAKPSIYNLFFYNLDEQRQFTASKKLKTTLVSSGNYKLNSTVLVNTQQLGIGVHSVDLFTGTSNKNGVYEVKLYDNENLNFHYRVDELSFDNTKHVFSHCDYWQKKNHNNTVHKCFVEKGNKLPTYPLLFNQGEILLLDDAVHSIRIEVSDFHGNTSIANFKVEYQAEGSFFTPKEEEYSSLFLAGERNQFRNDNVRISLGESVLFDDLYFQYKERAHNSYGPYIELHNSQTPVSGYFDIALKYHDIDTSKLDKYLIAYYDYKNRKKSIGGMAREGFIHGETRKLGTYFIDLDTIAPKISALNISEGKQMTYQKKIEFRVSDNFSGIETYNAFVNGKWVIMAYDAKRNLMSYTIDENTVKGVNDFEFLVADERGNVSMRQYSFSF